MLDSGAVTTDYGKATDGFARLGTSLEPIPADLGTATTPVERFFACTAGDAPDVDDSTWALSITGDAVKRPVTLSFDQVTALPSTELTAWLECAGNGRRLFAEVAGHAVPANAMNTEWTLNGMGIATWTGTSLSNVLDRADISDDAAWISPVGLDIDNPEGEPVRMCLPRAKALDPDTLVVWAMNGQPLPRAHGAPVRLLVPGWVGAYSVKWLGGLTVSTDWVPSWRADEYYRHRTPEGAVGEPVTAHPVKSSLALPFPAELTAGRHALHGYARSGDAAISTVEWSLDGGPWHEAEIDPAVGRWGWTVFRFDLTLDGKPGTRHLIRTRATDASGAVQPETQPLHPMGVLWKSVIPHPVVVRAAEPT